MLELAAIYPDSASFKQPQKVGSLTQYALVEKRAHPDYH